MRLRARSIVLKTVVCLAAISLSAATASAMRAWDGSNSPDIFKENYVNGAFEQRLDRLPVSGATAAPLWSDTYWPSRFGGAAWRWQIGQLPGARPEADPHNYGTYPASQIPQLTDEQLNQLSPAEKYDIVMGHYDYPTVQHERERTSPNMEKWHGLCHAVAAVTTRYYEPRNTLVSFQTAQGERTIMFYSSDLKALLALAADRFVLSQAGAMGQSCTPKTAGTSACWDTNPASFYLVLTNLMGRQRGSVIMDVDPGYEIWNTPIKDYSATITPKEGVNQNAARGTVREVLVDLTVRHTLGKKPAINQVGLELKTVNYSFTLEIAADNRIIGGEWISKNRPDQIWRGNDVLVLDSHFSFLNQLLQPLR